MKRLLLICLLLLNCLLMLEAQTAQPDSIFPTKDKVNKRSKSLRSYTLRPIIVQDTAPAGTPAALGSKTIYPDTDAPAVGTGGLLLQNSALSSSNASLTGEQQYLSILGNLSRHTLIMLDEIPLNPDGQAYDISRIPMQDIERIEIIEGNASAYGGASAIGGIVSIYTRNALQKDVLKLKQETEAGAYGLFSHSWQAQMRWDNLSAQAGYRHYQARNNFEYKPPSWWVPNHTTTREHNARTGDGGNFQIDFARAGSHLVYKADYDSFDKELPGPVNFAELYDHAFLKGSNLTQNLRYSLSHKEGNATFSAWQTADKTIYDNMHSTIPVYAQRTRQERLLLGAKAEEERHIWHLLLHAEAQANQQRYSSDDVHGKERMNYAGSLMAKKEWEYDLLTFNLSGTGRADWLTDFGTFPSYRVEGLVNWQGRYDFTAGANVGTAFSVPSFYDLYWKGDSQALGNPELKPETSAGGSAWLSFSSGIISMKASRHLSSVKDLIQWRQTFLYGVQWQPVNIGKAELNSTELETTIQPLSWLSAEGSVAFTDARDRYRGSGLSQNPGYGKVLVYTPDVRAQAKLSVSHMGEGLSLSLNHTGRQYTTPDNAIAPLHAVTTWDMNGWCTQKVKRLSITFKAAVLNLTDRQYEIYAYIPQPGRHFTASFNLDYHW